MRVTCYFDYGSPYSYLAWHRMQRDLGRYGHPRFVPVSLYHIVQREGGKINAQLPNLLRFNRADVARYAAAQDAPLRIPDSFPTNSLPAARVHLHVQGTPAEDAWMRAVWAAHWQDGLDIADINVLRQLAAPLDLDPAALSARPELKAALAATTDEAYARGAPGVPYIVIDDDRDGFWGNDRLDWVAARVAGRPAPAV